MLHTHGRPVTAHNFVLCSLPRCRPPLRVPVFRAGRVRQPRAASVRPPRGLTSHCSTARESVAVAVETAPMSGSATLAGQLESDKNGLERLAYRKQGWNFWNWKGNQIHYVKAGSSGSPVVLVHGFGASAYHWRYTIPALAAKHRVFAVDLLGFGWSDKPLVQYDGYGIWSDQLTAFIKEVVGGDAPVVLVGNSLGGYNAMATAAAAPNLVRGVVLLNGAGRFEDVKTAVEAPAEAALGEDGQPLKQALREAADVAPQDAPSTSAPSPRPPAQRPGGGLASALRAGKSANSDSNGSWLGWLAAPFKAVAVRGAVYLSFLAAKQPARIRQVLSQVYEDQQYIDDDLVDSIVQPARNVNAAEVFYRIITGSGRSVNALLSDLGHNATPLLLLWGANDPWIRPTSAERIMQLYPRAERVLITAGHCPQDDAPERVNQELLRWLSSH